MTSISLYITVLPFVKYILVWYDKDKIFVYNNRRFYIIFSQEKHELVIKVVIKQFRFAFQ